MKASILNTTPMAAHLQQPQPFNMVQSLATAGTGCGAGNQAAASAAPLIPTVFSEPESELTCNLSGSRKRPRDAQPPLGPLSSTALYQQQQQQQFLLQKQLFLLNQINRKAQPTADTLPMEMTSRINQSAMTSTSGRPPLMACDPSGAASPATHASTAGTAATSSSSGLISMLHYHNLEVDALVRLHTDKLRSGMTESCKRHCRAVVAAMEQHAQRRVAEKQAELDAALERNADLEERLKQAAAESQAWFNVAKTSEATVAGLRASLESALLQKISAGAGVIPAGAVEEGEGYGDSQEEALTAAAASAAVSCSVRFVEAGVTDRVKPSAVGVGLSSSACRSCGVPDACVLLLPCRHLCLCRSCEPSTDACPVCFTRKNASLQINLS